MKKQTLKRRSNILRNSTALTRPAALVSALAAVALGGGSAFAVDADSLPTGGNVVGGSATINQSNARMDINQTSNRTVIDWRSFDIGKDAQVNFDQPTSSSIAVNRVNASANASQINGSLTANGQVWILNANGVMFGKNARVDVAGLVASTARLDQNRFMAGDNRLEFSKGGTGSVVNEGQISIRDGGLAAFVAPAVRNNGVITAKLGRVALASGDTFTLDLAGDSLVEIGLGSDMASTEQFGQILADGGVIEISAKAAGDVVDSLVNLEGITSAASAEVEGGKIILGGDTVQIAGTVDASGATGGGTIDIAGDTITTAATADIRSDGLDTGDGGVIMAYANIAGQYGGSFSAIGGANGGDGGFVETSGKQVKISEEITVNTSAKHGDTGTWSVDPDDLTVVESGGDGVSTINASTIVSNLETTNVNLEANDSITVDTEIDSSAQTNSNALALVDQNSDGVLTVNLNAEILLGSNQTLTGEGSHINVASTGSIQNGIDVAAVGAIVDIAAGTYDLTSTVTIDKSGLTVEGDDGAIVTIGDNRAVAFSIAADNVSLENMTIKGSFSSPYTETDWDAAANNSTGISVATNLAGVSILNNTITDVRTGMTLGTNSEVFVNGNTIDNTKGSILVRTDDATITANSRGAIGNEWDIVLFGVSADAYTASPLTNEAQYGADIMALSSDNGDMWVLDRRYGSGGFIADTPEIGNRSHVSVLAGSTVTSADDFGLGNGLGNERQPLATINEGISAVVDGGIVNVQAGTYTEKVSVDKTVQLLGAQAGVDARDRDSDESVLDGAVVFTAESDGSVLDGLKITEGRSDVGEKAGVVIQREATDIAIQNTLFERETELGGNGDGYRGIVTFSNGNQTGLLFENNSFSGWATGIYLNPGATGAQILDNNFVTNYVGVSNDGPDGSVITGNLFADSGFEGLGIGPGVVDPSATISDNIFQDNSVDIGFYLGSDAEIDVSDNNFDGIDAATATIDELLVIAAQVKDGSDSADGYSGHASLRDGYVFVTDGGSISDGIGLAEEGDTVSVGLGDYSGSVVIDKSIELAGQDGATITLDNSSSLKRIVDIRADDVTVDGFTFDGNGTHVGVSISGQNAVVSDNTIKNVLTGIQTTTQNVAGNNTITGNDITDSGYGISLQNNDNTVTSNTIDVETEGFGIGSSGNEFTGNVVTVDAGGVLLQTYTTEDYAALPGADINLMEFLANNTANNAVYVADSDFAITVQTLFGDIQAGINAASDADIVVASTGTHVLDSTLNVAKSVSLAGQGEGETIIDATDVTGYGVYVTADDVSLSDFTLYGPSAGNNTNRGIKVNPSSVANAPLNDFSISDVTIQGSTMAELDINGVSGVTITNVTALGYLVSDGTTETAGAGIQITDSEDVTMTGVTTAGNAWGGVALYQANRSYDLQVNNITIDAAENTFNEANGLYIQDSSDSYDFGTLNLDGFTHTVRNGDFRSDGDQFTFFQIGEQTAVDFALSLGSDAASYIEDWSGTANTGAFTVGTGTEGAVMSIMTAINAASYNDLIKILSGTYDESIVLERDFATNGLTISGDATSRSSVTGGIRTLQTSDIDGLTFENLSITGVAENGNMVFDMDNTGIVTDLALDNLVIDGESVSGLHGFGGQNLAGDFSVTNSIFQNILGWSLMDMDPGNGEISNRQVVTSITFSDNIIKDSNGNVLLRGNADTPTETVVAENNSFSNIGGNSDLAGDQRNALSINNALDVTVEGNSFSNINVGNFGTGHALLLGEGIVSTSIKGNEFNGNEMNFGLESAIEVDLSGNSFDDLAASDMTNTELLAVAETVYDGTDSANGYAGLALLKEDHVFVTEGRSILAGVGLASAGDTVVAGSGTFNEDVADDKQLFFAFNDTIVNKLTLNTAGSGLSGSVTADTGGFEFTADVILDGDTVLTDSADAGIVTAAINGTSAGGQSLITVSGGSVELGSLGSTTRLGVTDIEGSAITLNGGMYNVNSLVFEGPVTVTQDLTVFETTQSETAAGDITFTNDIFGMDDASQSISFIAGNGAGDPSSNGTVSLQNAGTEAVKLGDMTATAHEFLAATVYIEGDFNSTQTGSLTFTEETLNAGGDVTTDVGGDVTGPIKSEGDVEVVATGDIDSDIEGGEITVTSTEGAVESELTATESVTVVAEEDVNVEVISGGDVDVTSESASVDATVETTETVSVTGAEEVIADVSGSKVEIESEASTVEAQVEATETVSVIAEEEVTVNASGSDVVIESETSTVDATVTATDTVSVTAEEEVTGEIIASSDVNVSSDNASVDVDIDTDEDVNVAAKEEVKGTVSGGNVSIEGEDISSDVTAEEKAVLSGTTIDSNVEAETAIVEAEETLSGTVTATNAEVTAETVDVTVDAQTVILDADDGNVQGNIGDLVVEGGVLDINGQTVNGDSEADINQQIVVDFTLPDGVTVSDTGDLNMPDLMKIGVISPVGETGSTPQVVIVNTVQSLGELLENGYKAIVVNLDGGTPTAIPVKEEN